MRLALEGEQLRDEAMRAPRFGVPVRAILTILTAVTVSMNVQLASAQALPKLPDEVPLTAAQEQSIRDEMAGLFQVLVSGGTQPQDAKLAVNAVGLCLGAAYGHSLTRDQASAVCGQVLDAFTVQPGTVAYPLTPDDQTWIVNKVGAWTGELGPMLSPDELGAVKTTMGACLEGHMKRGEDREKSVGQCALGLLPLLNRPELRQRLLESAGKLP